MQPRNSHNKYFEMNSSFKNFSFHIYAYTQYIHYIHTKTSKKMDIKLKHIKVISTL